jgi:hypothetical protein
MLPHLKTTTVTLEYQVFLSSLVLYIYNSRIRSHLLQALNDAVFFFSSLSHCRASVLPCASCFGWFYTPLLIQAKQAKKKWRGRLDGANIKRMCSPLSICVLLLCVVLFALMGGFYGVGDHCKIFACWPTQQSHDDWQLPARPPARPPVRLHTRTAAHTLKRPRARPTFRKKNITNTHAQKVLINSLDTGKAHHETGTGFW